MQFLLSRGADKTVTNTKDEVAGQLTDRLDIHTLLGGEKRRFVVVVVVVNLPHFGKRPLAPLSLVDDIFNGN